MLGFLKHCCLRIVVRTVAKRPPLKERIEDLFKRPMTAERLTMKMILDEIAGVDPEAGDIVEYALRSFRPRLVFNMGRHPDELKVARTIDRSLHRALSIEADHFGFVFEDPAVRRCVREGAVFLPDHSGGAAGKALIQTAERIVGFWDREIPESASRIRSRARELFEESERVGSSLNRGTSFA